MKRTIAIAVLAALIAASPSSAATTDLGSLYAAARVPIDVSELEAGYAWFRIARQKAGREYLNIAVDKHRSVPDSNWTVVVHVSHVICFGESDCRQNDASTKKATFKVDHALESAMARFRLRGRWHSVKWVASEYKSVMPISSGEHYCPWPVLRGAGAGVWRGRDVQARLFGRRYEQRLHVGAVVSWIGRGVVATTCGGTL